MYTLILSILGLALASFQYALAFVDFIIPSTIAAGQDTQIQIVNDLAAAGNSSADSHFRNFRVYLFLPIPGWSLEKFGYYPTCRLTDELSIDVTTVTIRIPASVGPDASNYQFTLEEYRCDGAYCNNYIQASSNFKLIGGRGEWSQAELAGHNIGPDFNGLSCAAYECERRCNHKHIPGNWSSANSYEETQKCVKKCFGAALREPPGKPFNYTGPGSSQDSFQNSTISPNVTIGQNTTLCQHPYSSPILDTAKQTAIATSSSSSFGSVIAETFEIQTSSVLASSSPSCSPMAETFEIQTSSVFTSSSISSSPTTLASPTTTAFISSTAAIYISLVTTTVTETITPTTATIATTTTKASPATSSSAAHRSFHLNTYSDDSKTSYLDRSMRCLGGYGMVFIFLSIILV